MVDSSKLDTLEMILYRAGDEPKPATNKNHLRLYGHNLCPFVARARYALAAKNIEFQEVQVDLNNKAQWHLDLNGGLVPIMETPAGDLLPESGVAMSYAEESAGEQGYKLIPSDPIQAAKMRLEQCKADSYNKHIFPLIMSRGEDPESIEAFNIGLAAYEEMCKKAGDKWLFGTDEPTMLDIHCGGLWDMLFTFVTVGGVYEDIKTAVEAEKHAPHWCAYMRKFRADKAFKPYRYRNKAVQNHGIRSRAWEKGVKCQLSIDVLEDVDFAAED